MKRFYHGRTAPGSHDERGMNASMRNDGCSKPGGTDHFGAGSFSG